MASWAAVQGRSNAEVFERLGLAEAEGETLPGSRKAPFSYRRFANDWLVVFSEDFDWASEQRLVDLSDLGLALACQFEDKVEMTASISAARHGALLWKVFHNNTKSVFRLDVEGAPPLEFERLREEAYRLQREDGGDDSSCDFVHEVVHELGKAVCGYRADEEMAAFQALRRSRASSPFDGREGRPTLLEKIFAPLRRKHRPVD